MSRRKTLRSQPGSGNWRAGSARRACASLNKRSGGWWSAMKPPLRDPVAHLACQELVHNTCLARQCRVSEMYPLSGPEWSMPRIAARRRKYIKFGSTEEATWDGPAHAWISDITAQLCTVWSQYNTTPMPLSNGQGREPYR